MTAPPLDPTGRRPPAAPARRAGGGFTLVELLIVVVILAILAAVAIPRLRGERSEAAISALMANVNLVSMTLEYQRQLDESGDWPAAVDVGWFSSRRYPYHPDQPDGVPQVENVDEAQVTHPASKVLSPASAGAYWYNAANGSFRARVIDQGSTAATLHAYNCVNQSSLDSLTEQQGGGTTAAPGPAEQGGALPSLPTQPTLPSQPSQPSLPLGR